MDESATVLVVEDDDAVARLFAEWLDEEYDVRVAGTADAGLDALDDAVDVVLLDRKLPNGDGVDVAQRIQRGQADPCVVMVTSVEPDFDIVDLAVDDYLVKPVERATLRATVARLADRLAYDSELREYYALARKRAVLEERKATDELADSEEYATLLEECARKRRRADELLHDAGDYTGVFATLFSGAGAAAR